LTALEDEEIKIFGSSQGTRRNRERNPVDILDFKLRSHNRRPYRQTACDQEYSHGGRPC